MAFCSKCGKELAENAKFCANCGTPVESGTTKDETRERTQVFMGTIRKCPNCGEQIGTNTTKCPACGFVIEKRNVSASLDDFVKKLASFDHYIKKREYIENYPVPNNKEDIRDLLTYAASQRDKDYDDNVAKSYWVDAWNNKCRQIVNQAFDTFGMDEDFASWLKNYKAGVEKSSAENEKLKKKLRSIEAGKKRAAGAKKFFKGFGIILVILAVLCGAGFGIKSCLNKRADVERIISEGYTIPKENVSLGGILGTYCEVVDDAKITFPGIDKHWVDEKWHVQIAVSVQVRFKKDLSENYSKQYKDLIKGLEGKEYNVKCYDHMKSSLGESWSTMEANALFSAKDGVVMALSGTYLSREVHSFKKSAKKELQTMATNPLNTVTISISPMLRLYENDKYIKEIPLQ